jgi:hypothetical protein
MRQTGRPAGLTATRLELTRKAGYLADTAVRPCTGAAIIRISRQEAPVRLRYP